MKILLLSDTHSYIDDAILKHAKEADEVWHAGDIGDASVTDQIKLHTKLRAVYGNIDNQMIRQEFPEFLHFEVEGIEIWMTHIGGYPGKYAPKVRTHLLHHRPQLFICGHSHILKVMNDKTYELLHMNPGACGIHGFHQQRTMLKFEINKGKIEHLFVVDLGKRGGASL
jgi:putative phosphoesterase